MALIWMIVMFGLGIVQLAAFQAGLAEWLGFHWLLSIVIGGFALMMGPLGGIAVAIVGFFGAVNAWGWEWWQAALLCFPSLILAVLVTAISGTASLGGMLFSRGRS